MGPKQQPNIHAYVCIDRITAQESAIRLEIAEINKRNERLQLKIERLQLEIARQRNIIRDPPKRDPVLERWGFYEEPEPAAEPVAAPSATAARPEPAARPEQRDTASQPPDEMEFEASGGTTEPIVSGGKKEDLQASTTNSEPALELAAEPAPNRRTSQPPDKMELEASGGNTAAASLIISKAHPPKPIQHQPMEELRK